MLNPNRRKNSTWAWLWVAGALLVPGAARRADAAGSLQAEAVAAELRSAMPSSAAVARGCVLERHFDSGGVEQMSLDRVDPGTVRYTQTRRTLRTPGASRAASQARPTVVTQHVVTLQTREGAEGAFALRSAGQTVLSRQSQVVLDSRFDGAAVSEADARQLRSRGDRLAELFAAAATACGSR